MTRWACEAELSKLSREAHPIRAAERRQNIAHGVSRGFSVWRTGSPVRGERFRDSFAPMGLEIRNDSYPGLRPGLHSGAAPRLNKDAPSAQHFISKTRNSSPNFIIHAAARPADPPSSPVSPVC